MGALCWLKVEWVVLLYSDDDVRRVICFRALIAKRKIEENGKRLCAHVSMRGKV